VIRKTLGKIPTKTLKSCCGNLPVWKGAVPHDARGAIKRREKEISPAGKIRGPVEWGRPLDFTKLRELRKNLGAPGSGPADNLMRVIVLASQKGGSGKTTLSGHLAVEADRAGAGPVALIDTDPQGSLSDWWNTRQASSPHFAKVELTQLGGALTQLHKSGIRLAVIDTPPAITASISHVVAYADLVVVPTRPSPHDLRAVGATVAIAEEHQKALIFVINAATPRARITGEAAVALSQHGTVAPITIHHRVDFAASMVDGRTVSEVVPGSASAREVRDLWTYVQDRLARLTRDAGLATERAQQFATSALTSFNAESAADEPAPAELAEAEPDEPREPDFANLTMPARAERQPLTLPQRHAHAAEAPQPPGNGFGRPTLVPGAGAMPAPLPPIETILQQPAVEERRSGEDRRQKAGAGPFAGTDRRAFGRRSTDRAGNWNGGHK
jgi:chromosome partitioning protein